jgi:peptidoglycan/xylan/chitin deacetylase (PgdA/CDA1 family)
MRPAWRSSAVAALAAGAAAAYWGVGAAVTPLGRRLLDRRQLLCSVPTEAPLVALTFDDGPDPALTGRFLVALDGAPATFFALGERVRRAPHLAAKILAAGHELACHGDIHQSLASLPPAATVAALRRARDSITAACGQPPRWYRPAYGVFNLAGWLAAPRLGMTRTLWTAWARDWEPDATPDLIATRTLQAARPGAILLLHDADGAPGAPERTLAALPLIRAGLEALGLRPVTLSGLVAAGGRGAAPAGYGVLVGARHGCS